MGLQATVQSLVKTAFEAIGDIPEAVDYTHEGQEPDYDPTSGAVTPDPATFTVRLERVLFIPFKDNETAPSALVAIALPGDYLVLIAGLDLSVKPTTGDKIVRQDETWIVKGFTSDPAEGLWKILARHPGGGADGEVQFHE